MLRMGLGLGNGEGMLHLEHGLLEGSERGDALVLGALGVEKRNEHVTVAFPLGRVGAENLADGRWRGLDEMVSDKTNVQDRYTHLRQGLESGLENRLGRLIGAHVSSRARWRSVCGHG